MSGKFATLDNVRIGRYRYLFIVITWNAFESPVYEQVKKHKGSFGEALADKGLAAGALNRFSYQIGEEILKKPWPDDIRLRLETAIDPCMLIINVDYTTFLPQEHPWAIVWFSDFEDEPDRMYRIFARLAQKTTADQDVFEYLRYLAQQDARKAAVARVSRYIEFKPKIFGIMINASAIFQDVAGIGRG